MSKFLLYLGIILIFSGIGTGVGIFLVMFYKSLKKVQVNKLVLIQYLLHQLKMKHFFLSLGNLKKADSFHLFL